MAGLEAVDILNEFGAKIRPVVATHLGEPAYVNTLGVSSDDRSVVILILDLGPPDANGAMLLGYFDPVHAFVNDPSHSLLRYSNALPMVFLNSRVLTEFGGSVSFRVNQFLLTLAHEFQHLHNFYYNVGQQQIGQMDTWIDEMLSAAAEFYYTGQVDTGRINYFTGAGYNFSVNGKSIDSYNPYVAMGQNHVAWGRPWTDVLTSYASVHMKMNWLRLHANDSGIFRDMVLSSHTDALAVSSSAEAHGIATNGWPELLRTWAAANWLRSGTELFGYKGEPPFQTGKIETLNKALNDSVVAISDSRYVLGPGEFIYVKPDSSPSFNVEVTDNDIFYARLTSTGVDINGDLNEDETLLAYNTRTNPFSATLQTRALPLPESLVSSSSIGSLSTNYSGPLRVTPPPGPHGVDMVFRDSGVGGVSAQGGSGGVSSQTSGAPAPAPRITPNLDEVLRERLRALEGE
ncbi:MAG: hypothetical protein EA428_15200 [Spirochaetaceae bacterium]|nr:MAG: hypothetical protein EA428_15200 [Spirochaetaceae bacterium]